jgi:hypothetical protein
MTDFTPEQKQIYETGETLFWMHLLFNRHETDWNELVNITSKNGLFGDTDIEKYYLMENGFPTLEEAHDFVRFIKSYYNRHKKLPKDMPKRDLILRIINLRT